MGKRSKEEVADVVEADAAEKKVSAARPPRPSASFWRAR
jgi:hypothetical protein